MNSTEVQNPWCKLDDECLYAYHNWFRWLMIHWVFQWLLCLFYELYPAVACVKSVQMFQKFSCLPCVRFCSWPCIVYSNVSEAFTLAICVQFCSCLCKVCSCVSEALLLTLQTLSLSFVTNNSSSDSKAFCISLRCQAPQQQYSVLSFSSSRCEGMATVTNWPFHVHYSITLWASPKSQCVIVVPHVY